MFYTFYRISFFRQVSSLKFLEFKQKQMLIFVSLFQEIDIDHLFYNTLQSSFDKLNLFTGISNTDEHNS